MNFTALGGSVWALGVTPMLVSTSLREFRYLRNVLALTPASRANSDLYMDFISIIYNLTIYDLQFMYNLAI